MKESFSSDRPVSKKEDDRFQRYEFSKRLANAISNRNHNDGIVIGLYGAWGEGKTSILNFIQQELEQRHPNVIWFTFNPWIFPDEKALLMTFFNDLATEIEKNLQPLAPIEGKSLGLPKGVIWWQKLWQRNQWWQKVFRRKPLQTKTETIAELFQQYGKAITYIGIEKIAETFGKALSPSIEKLKSRLESKLAKVQRPIVIFIDDVDRLEINEIHAIFRLVKLTGHFSYITYILPFDDNMVASAIGEKYGAGNQKAGNDFLEKIIQVPIKIPLAQKSALRLYCYEFIQRHLDNSNIVLTENEWREFTIKFDANYLIRLTTPRSAIRYANAISFSLPLLKGEVNYVDLLLVEALRVFYPELYDFARTQPSYILDTYKNHQDTSLSQKRHENFLQLFEKHTHHYSELEVENAKGALIDLFPNLLQAWQAQTWHRNIEAYQNRYRQKRISTSEYFDRYFSFTVIEGDVSDVALDSLLEGITGSNYQEKIDSVQSFIERVDLNIFWEKIRSQEKSFNSDTSIGLIKIFSKIDCFPSHKNSYVRWSPNMEMILFLEQLIKNQIDIEKKLSVLQWVIKESVSFEFAVQIFKAFYDTDNRIFTDTEFRDFASIIVERAKDLSAERPIWELFNTKSSTNALLRAWVDVDKKGLQEYVQRQLDTNSQFVILLLKVFVPLIHSSAYPEPYDGDFQEGSYHQLNEVLDTNFIYQKIQEVLDIDLSSIIAYNALDGEQTDDNMMRQFAFWHNQTISKHLVA